MRREQMMSLVSVPGVVDSECRKEVAKESV
jgi:hypothetical protein